MKGFYGIRKVYSFKYHMCIFTHEDRDVIELFCKKLCQFQKGSKITVRKNGRFIEITLEGSPKVLASVYLAEMR